MKYTIKDNRYERVESKIPSEYRLCKRGDEFILQGKFDWFEEYEQGFEWRDIPTHIDS